MFSKMFKFKYVFTIVLALFLGAMFISESYARRSGGSRSSSRSSYGSKKSSPSKSYGKRKTSSKSKKYTKKATTAQQKAKIQQQKRAATVKSNRKAVLSKRSVASNKARIASTKKRLANTSKKDWTAKRSSYMKGKKTYTPTYNSKSRYSGNQRTIIVNRYNNSYGGYYYGDPYNHSLIWSFSSIWWYHHWATIDRSHYGDDSRMRKLETEIAVLKAKNTPVNENYQDEGMDESVQYGDGYLEGVKNDTLKPEAKSNVLLAIFLTAGIVIILCGGAMYFISRRKTIG